MSTLERELIKGYVRQLSRMHSLLTADELSPAVVAQLETLLESVLSDMRVYLQRISWPEPTVDEPDQATLEEWFEEDGGCEATDGCFVEPDGTCPHGHPSWFLVLGLI